MRANISVEAQTRAVIVKNHVIFVDIEVQPCPVCYVNIIDLVASKILQG